MSSRTLGFGPMSVALTSDDCAAANWLAEVLQPCFAPTTQIADWHVELSSRKEAHADLCGRRPLNATPRACFAHDTRVISLPAWSDGATAVALADDERRCFLVVRPSRIDLFGDPASRRWRFTSMCVLQEIAATRLRRTALDVHAAAVEAAGRAILIVGPKGAGKTTLSLHLLRSGRCRSIANDRVFAGAAGSSFDVRGVPTAVKLHPPMIAEFPELRRGLPPHVERPYLYSLDELARASPAEEDAGPAEIALSPPQLMRQMNVEALGSAPLGAVVFPEIRSDVDAWAVERLEPRDVSGEIWANLYGCRSGARAPTVFEEVGGGSSVPSRSLADALSESVPGHRIVLGRHAYDEPAFAARLLDVLLG